VAPPPASPIVEALLAGEPTAAVDSDTPADQALAGAAAEFQDVPPPRRMPLTPLERAAHHLGFKRVMWRVAAGVGLLLAGFAAYSFWQVFGTDIGDPPPLPVPGAQLFVDKFGKGWAIPDGAEVSPQPSGRVYYYYKAEEVGAPDGEEVLATPVDDPYVKERVKYDRAAAGQAEIRGHYAVFGLMFSVVGLVMLLLGFWMYHDVRTVQLADVRAVRLATEAIEGHLSNSNTSGRAAWVLGAFVVAIGLILIWHFNALDVGVSGFANLDLMNQRTNGIILGVGMLIAGIMVIGIGFFLRFRRRD
jgi:hypothetical protein